MLVVAVRAEDTKHRLRHAQQLRSRQELVQHARRRRQDGGASAGGNAKPAAAVRTDYGTEAQIVDGGLHVVVGASFECDLEFPGQRRAQRVPQQKSRQRLGVRRDVEALVRRNTRVRACGDIPDGVAARFTGSQTGVRESPHRRFDVVQMNEMKL